MHFGPLFGRSKKSRLQPARNQPFAHKSKMRHLYDKDEFRGPALFSHFLCNLMMLNVFRARNVLFETSRFCVNPIICPSRNAKKARFLLTPISRHLMRLVNWLKTGLRPSES